MKRFVAFHSSSNSGIQSKEKAIEWATNLLGQGKVGSVHLAEVIEVLERATPQITAKPFFVQLEGDEAKAA